MAQLSGATYTALTGKAPPASAAPSSQPLDPGQLAKILSLASTGAAPSTVVALYPGFFNQIATTGGTAGQGGSLTQAAAQAAAVKAAAQKAAAQKAAVQKAQQDAANKKAAQDAANAAAANTGTSGTTIAIGAVVLAAVGYGVYRATKGSR